VRRGIVAIADARLSHGGLALRLARVPHLQRSIQLIDAARRESIEQLFHSAVRLA